MSAVSDFTYLWFILIDYQTNWPEMLQFIAKLKHKLGIAAGQYLQFETQLKRTLPSVSTYQLISTFLLSEKFYHQLLLYLNLLFVSPTSFIKFVSYLASLLIIKDINQTVPPFFLHLFPLHAMLYPHILLFLILRSFMVVFSSQIQTFASALINLLLLFLKVSCVIKKYFHK